MSPRSIADGKSFIARVDRLARERPDSVAVIAGDAAWTFDQLSDQSRRLATSLAGLGIEPGDRIALHALNIPELVIAFLGCLRAGAVVVPINTRLKASEVKAICDLARPRLYIGQRALMDGLVADGADAGLPDLRYLFNSDEAGPDPSWTRLLAASPDSRPVERNPDDAAFLLSTSGTTGAPKLVVWTDATLLAIGEAFDGEELHPDDVILQQMPMMHAGATSNFAYALTHGACLVMVPKFDEEVVLDTIERAGCTSLLATPSMYAALVRAQRARPRDLGSLRFCVVAGDVCPPAVEQAFEQLAGQPVYARWGATEDVVTGLHGCKPGPFFRGVPRDAWKIVDADGRELGVGRAGEILTRSAGTTPGYWQADGSIDRLPDGWFHSGDRVREEEDGELRYVGRIKDVIVRESLNISPVEVETALIAVSGVEDVAVLGLPDDDVGQRVGAVLVLSTQASDDEAPGLVASLRDSLADYKVPELVKVVDEVPRNALGKIERKKLADLPGDWRPV